MLSRQMREMGLPRWPSADHHPDHASGLGQLLTPRTNARELASGNDMSLADAIGFVIEEESQNGNHHLFVSANGEVNWQAVGDRFDQRLSGDDMLPWINVDEQGQDVSTMPLEDTAEPSMVSGSVATPSHVTEPLTSKPREEEDASETLGRVGPRRVTLVPVRGTADMVSFGGAISILGRSNFSTLRGSVAVFRGRWMYEVQLGTSGIMQLGWTPPDARFNSDEGVGDAKDSYAYDGKRQRKWNVKAAAYGERWTAGDIISCAIDLERGEVSYWRNGTSLGSAFTGLRGRAVGIAYLPGVSMSHGERCEINFGGRPFAYPQADFKPLQAAPNPKAIARAEMLVQCLKRLHQMTELAHCKPPATLHSPGSAAASAALKAVQATYGATTDESWARHSIKDDGATIEGRHGEGFCLCCREQDDDGNAQNSSNQTSAAANEGDEKAGNTEDADTGDRRARRLSEQFDEQATPPSMRCNIDTLDGPLQDLNLTPNATLLGENMNPSGFRGRDAAVEPCTADDASDTVVPPTAFTDVPRREPALCTGDALLLAGIIARSYGPLCLDAYIVYHVLLPDLQQYLADEDVSLLESGAFQRLLSLLCSVLEPQELQSLSALTAAWFGRAVRSFTWLNDGQGFPARTASRALRDFERFMQCRPFRQAWLDHRGPENKSTWQAQLEDLMEVRQPTTAELTTLYGKMLSNITWKGEGRVNMEPADGAGADPEAKTDYVALTSMHMEYSEAQARLMCTLCDWGDEDDAPSSLGTPQSADVVSQSSESSANARTSRTARQQGSLMPWTRGGRDDARARRLYASLDDLLVSSGMDGVSANERSTLLQTELEETLAEIGGEDSHVVVPQPLGAFLQWLEIKNAGAVRDVPPPGLSSPSVLPSVFFVVLRMLRPVLLHRVHVLGSAFRFPSGLFFRGAHTIAAERAGSHLAGNRKMPEPSPRLGGTLTHLIRERLTSNEDDFAPLKVPGTRTLPKRRWIVASADDGVHLDASGCRGPWQWWLLDRLMSLYVLGVGRKLRLTFSYATTMQQALSSLQQMNQRLGSETSSGARQLLELSMEECRKTALIAMAQQCWNTAVMLSPWQQESMLAATSVVSRVLTAAATRAGPLLAFVPEHYLEGAMEMTNALRHADARIWDSELLMSLDGLASVVSCALTIETDGGDRIISPDARMLISQTIATFLVEPDAVVVMAANPVANHKLVRALTLELADDRSWVNAANAMGALCMADGLYAHPEHIALLGDVYCTRDSESNDDQEEAEVDRSSEDGEWGERHKGNEEEQEGGVADRVDVQINHDDVEDESHEIGSAGQSSKCSVSHDGQAEEEEVDDEEEAKDAYATAFARKMGRVMVGLRQEETWSAEDEDRSFTSSGPIEYIPPPSWKETLLARIVVRGWLSSSLKSDPALARSFFNSMFDRINWTITEMLSAVDELAQSDDDGNTDQDGDASPNARRASFTADVALRLLRVLEAVVRRGPRLLAGGARGQSLNATRLAEVVAFGLRQLPKAASCNALHRYVVPHMLASYLGIILALDQGFTTAAQGGMGKLKPWSLIPALAAQGLSSREITRTHALLSMLTASSEAQVSEEAADQEGLQLVEIPSSAAAALLALAQELDGMGRSAGLAFSGDTYVHSGEEHESSSAEGQRRGESSKEDEAEPPEEYLDPIMATLMVDPVVLPSSGIIVDRLTIERHLLSSSTDPFSRAPLALEDVEADDGLRMSIQNWLQKRRMGGGDDAQ